MATTIRLTRMGKKKRPFYRLVVLDSRKRRDGAYLANLGYYNPFCEPHEVNLHSDDIISWLSKGATMSDTARSLLRREGVLLHYSLIKQGLAEDEIESQMAAWNNKADDRKQKATAAGVARKDAVRTEREDRETAAQKAAEEAAAAEAKAAEEAAAAAEAEAAAKAAEAKAAAEEPAEEEAPAEESTDEAGEDK